MKPGSGRSPSISLAYDGSLHGDWVARYAIRLARAAGTHLDVIYVDEGKPSVQDIEARVDHLRELGAAMGVDAALRPVPLLANSVAASLTHAVPTGEESMILTGLRARASPRGLIHETVSEELLRLGAHDVLAIRVVSPSLLGHARHALFTLSENPTSVQRVAPFLRLLAPELTRISLLTVVAPRLGRRQHPTRSDLHLLRACGTDFLYRAEAALRSVLAPLDVPLDPIVAIDRDWAATITRHAARSRAELLLLGATERTLTRRFVFGNPLESILRHAVCDVAIFRRSRKAVT